MFLLECALLLLGLCLYAFLWKQTVLEFGAVSYRYDKNPKQTSSMPLSVDSDGSILTGSVHLHLMPIHSTHFTIVADDCLSQLTINTKVFPNDPDTPCDYTQKRPVDLRNYLKSGENTLRFVIQDSGGKGGIDIQPSSVDPVVMLRELLLFAIIALGIFIIVRHVPKLRGSVLPKIFFVGVILRWSYFLATPSSVRSYDSGAHVDYIFYVLRQWNIPATSQGWESYQPPLYYFLSALWLQLTNILGLSGFSAETRTQFLSVLFSVGAFLVALWIGFMLYPEEKQKGKLLLFGSLMATIPALLLMSPRIGNDSLFHLLAFLAFALLLRWWNTKGRISRRFWIASCITIALGILTKSNMLPILAIAWILLVFKKTGWKEKVMLFGISAAILLLLTDWLYLLRFLTEGSLSIVGNVGNLSSGLLLKSSLPHLLAFPPLLILQQPFNDPWADALGRQYFLTYLFRSAFFGEFSFSPLLHLAQGMLALALIAIPIFVFGISRDLMKNARRSLPLAIAFIVLIASHFAFRIHAPFSPSEDFRFSILMVIPVIAFVIDGAYALPKWLRRLGLGVIWLLVLACTAFFILIPFVM